MITALAVSGALCVSFAAPADAAEDSEAEFTLESISESSSNRRDTGAKNIEFVEKTEGGTADGAVLKNSAGVFAVADTSLVNAADEDARILAAASSDFVDLSWTAIDGAADYDILRDGVKIATTSGLTFRDNAVEVGSHYRYEVSTTAPKPADEEEIAAQQNEIAFPSSSKWGYIRSTTAVIPVGTKRSQSLAVMEEAARAANGVWVTRFYYMTFIRQQWLEAPFGSCEYTAPNHVYEGNARGFYPANSFGTIYKTRLDSSVYWDDGELRNGLYIRPTYVYKKNADGTKTGPVDERTAEGTNSIRDMGSTSASKSIRVAFQAGDPFCFFGSIQSVMRATLTSGGSYAISGEHRAAPDHEIYLDTVPYDGDDVRRKIYEREMADLLCLVGGACETYTISTGG